MNRRRLLRGGFVAAALAVATLASLNDARSVQPAAPSSPCTRYAAPDGSDGARGTLRRPFETAQRLVDSLRAGETGCLRAGTYTAKDDEGPVVRFGRGGSPDRRITLRSYPGERAKLLGLVRVPRGSDYITIARLQIEGTGDDITVPITANGTIVQDNDISNAWRGTSCMLLGHSSFGHAARPIVRRNRFHECGTERDDLDHGIYAANTADGRIVDNVFWNSAGYAIHLFPDAQRTYVARNVVDGGLPSVRGGIVIGGDSSHVSTENLVEHNVVAYSRTANIESWWEDDSGNGNIVRDNCVWAGREGNVDTSNGGFVASGNVVALPRFWNRRKRDYRLRPTTQCRSVVPLTAGSLVPRLNP